MLRKLILAGLFLMQAACGGGTATRLTEADHGKTFEVTRPAQIELVIEGNPTTGYVWQLAPDSSTLIQQQGEPEYVSRGNQPGSPGTYTFRFAARETGSGKLKLVYLRPWEKDKPATRTFEVTVIMKDAAISGY
jgi:inhibitor of cysteine peptidase